MIKAPDTLLGLRRGIRRMPLNTLLMRLRRWQLPPLMWIAAVVLLQLGLLYFGFFHWVLAAGLLFSIYWLRPSREWPAWIVIFTLIVFIHGAIISWQSQVAAIAFLRDHGLAQIIIGNMLFAPLCLTGVWWLRRRGIRMTDATGLKHMAYLHGAALITALLLMAKDLAYLFNDGQVGDVVRGQAVNMLPIVWPGSAPNIAYFALSHFMGAFLGIMLVVPVVQWLLVPGNRAGSSRIIRSTLIYLYLLPMLLYFGNSVISMPDESLMSLLKILLLAAVVVFSFLHGWRGAALSVLLTSLLIALGDPLRGSTDDVVELQLYVAVMGAMALLFGASVDELRQNERLLLTDKQRLQVALGALAESSRRSLHSEELERKRLARELHDEMGQTLTAIQTQLSLRADVGDADESQRMEQLTQRLGYSLRSVVNALTPDELDQLGLYTAITHGSPAQMCERAGIEYTTEIYGDSRLLERLDMLTNLAAYRIVQEAVNNAIKHSHGQRVTVRLRIGERQRQILVLLDIRDDGIGLKSLRQTEHGFYSIRDRAAALNGVLNIQNLPGVRVHVMLRQ